MRAWTRSGSASRISMRSASGARRTRGAPINASGVLLDGTKVDGPAALRRALVAQKEQFVRTVTSKLLTYAIGRELEYYDAPAIRGIVRAAAADDYRWSSTILAIVKSAPFQMRRSRLMIVTRKAISRRTVLRGIGATVALPLLDAMVPALTAVPRRRRKRVRRLGVVYHPNGVIYDKWLPKGVGADFELSPTLAGWSRFATS